MLRIPLITILQPVDAPILTALYNAETNRINGLAKLLNLDYAYTKSQVVRLKKGKLITIENGKGLEITEPGAACLYFYMAQEWNKEQAVLIDKYFNSCKIYGDKEENSG